MQIRNEMLANQKRLEGLQTGGDSFCYFMLYYFDLENPSARDIVVIKQGEFGLHDLQLRVTDMDTSTDIFQKAWGELNAPAGYLNGRWALPPKIYYRIFFHARNGFWNQDLILKKSEKAQCWLAATRVLGHNGRDVIFLHIDNEYESEFGLPEWRD